jgi:hypothetical protein
MQNFKKYLIAIKKHEDDSGVFELVKNYIDGHNNAIIKDICRGEIYLPSFVLWKKIKQDYSNLTDKDEELQRLFEEAIGYSKLYYLRAVAGIDLQQKSLNKKRNQANSFEKYFQAEVKPLGQHLVNLIVNIKYRIIVVKNNHTIKCTSSNIFNLFKMQSVIKNSILYTINFFYLNNYVLAKRIYYGTMALLALCFWLIDFSMLDNVSASLYIIINIIFAILSIIIIKYSKPAEEFGTLDISGRDEVTHKYKAFLNNCMNSKMMKVFSMKESRK